MAYTISKSNGGTLILLNDGLADNQVTSLTLVGKNVSNFGDAQNENFVHILENFASAFEPRSPMQGQIWFDTSSNVFRPAVFDGTNWRPIATLLYSNTTTDTLVNAGFNNFAASNPGDFWFNSSSKQLHVITSLANDMTLIGPEAVYGFGVTKMSSVSIKDISNVAHPVIKMIVDGTVIGVVSTLTFATNEVDPYNIYKGITLSSNSALAAGTIWATTLNGNLVAGQITADNADITALLGVTAAIETVNVDTLNGTTGNFTTVSGDVVNGSTVNASTVNATNLTASGTGLITGTWKLNTNSYLTPNTDGSNDLGTSSLRFNNVYSKALSTGNSASAGDIIGYWKLTSGSSFTPTTDLGNDLGASSKRFGTVYTSGISASNGGNVISVTGSPNISGNVTPAIDNLYSLGSGAQMWAEVFADNIQTNAVDTTQLNSTNGTIDTLSVINATITTLTDAYSHTISQFDTDGSLAANSDARLATQRAIKTYVDYVAQGLTNLINAIPTPDTDGTLAANSNSRLATQRATKTYVDNTRSILQTEIDNIPRGGFGTDQTYENVTVARNFGTSYVNTTGKTMWVNATVSTADTDGDDPFQWTIAFVNGMEITRQVWLNNYTGAPCQMTLQFFVPPGASYYVNIYTTDEPPNQLSFGQSILNWIEFR